MKDMNGTGLLTDDAVPGLLEAAAVDTYQIVRYSFEVSNMMNWTREDFTAQHDIYFHVDDFVGLGGGSFGMLVPITGAQSMWCGTRPGTDDYLCSWGTAPGYGNSWNQHFESNEITVASTESLAFHVTYDCEGGGYDELTVDYLDLNGDWVTARTFGGFGDSVDVVSLTVAETGPTTKFRFHFMADSGWSDSDGLYNTDGAAILDDITVTADAVVLDVEDFEASLVDDHSTTFWTGFGEPAYGMASEMMSGLMEPDPCHEDYGTQWAFLEGSTELSTQQALYPGMYVTPRCLNGAGLEAPCQNEGIVSPVIDMTKHSTARNNIQDADIPVGDQNLFGGVLFRYQAYRDLPLDNLVFYTWSVRNIDLIGCPGAWKDRNYVYYGPDGDYLFTGENVSDLVTSPNDPLQLTFGVVDMCDVWGGYYGTCTNHSPSPWFDNVYVQRVKTSGPQWSFRKLDLFQDNFPPNADPSGFVRADAANDITETAATTRIDPGDSIVITVTSPTSAGIAGVDADGYEESDLIWPEVYIHFKVDTVLAGKIAADFAAVVDTGRMGFGGTMNLPTPTGPDGNGWFKVQARSAVVGESRNKVADKFMFDLNDELFTYNHVIEYYFSATDQNAEVGYLPTNALEGGAFEWTCLPKSTSVLGILYVDDYDGRGSWRGEVEDYLAPALTAVSNKGWDRYDINNPSSIAGNGLESRINATNLGLFYNTIIWDSGNFNTGTIGNNTPSLGKCNDVSLLQSWAEDQINHGHKTNMLIMGDGIVEDLYNTGAVSFLNNVLHVNLMNQSYLDMTGGVGGGGIISPLVTPVPGSAFDGLEDFYVFGGCPIINHFDVLDTTSSSSEYGLKYPAYGGSYHYAAICSDETTANNSSKRIVTTGFSFMYIRDADSHGVPVRIKFLEKVFIFFENGSPWTSIEEPDTIPEPPTHAITPYKLCQNYPNPFNPETTIKYTIKEKGYVSIRIYDISGRLVRTLVDGIKSKGPNQKIWKGVNDHGDAISSGVYFYKMKAGKYRETKKMILLK
jgi:hypothetical protein